MIKTLNNIFKQDKEKFVVPKGVQDCIPLTAIYDDGIFRVGKDKYSKSFKFTDINYAVASREDKEAMFLEYSELLNSLDSGATTKLTINNRRLNRLDFEKTILIPETGDELDEYREEYNKMLLDKATGANSTVQDKYVTISINKKNVDHGKLRISDTVNALNTIGVPTEHLYFLGYADNGGMGVGAFTTAFTDSFVYNIYVADDNKVISSRNGVTETYGNENVRNDYHYLTTGEHASYTRANFLADLKSVMESVNPTDVYMTSRYDMHYDHAYFGLFGIEAIKDIQAENNDFQPTVHEAIIHSHMTDEVYPKDQGNYGWNHELDTYLGAWQHLDGLEEKTMLNWSERENVLTPYSMRQGPFKYNLKDQALRKYSTEYYNWIASFSKVNEVFYKHETNSIGSLATVTASSENSSDSRWDDQSVVKAVDGVADGYATGLANLHTRFPWAEWATKNEGAGAWLSLAYDEVQKVTKIKIYDRPNTDDHITNSHLEFDDGTTLEVGELPNDGSVKEISLGEGKEVKNIKFVVDEVSESTTAVGLAEIEVIK